MSHIAQCLLCFVLVSVITSNAFSALRCSICGETITGQYFTYDSSGVHLTVCADCESTTGHCIRCGLPVAGTGRSDRDVLCRTCRIEVRTCDICSAKLLGDFYQDDAGHRFCPACNKSADRCSICQRLLLPGFWSMENGRQVCSDCLKTCDRCNGCGELITGRYSIYRGFDGKYCDTCVRKTPSCTSCLRPCGPDPVRLDNGSVVCSECALSAVTGSYQLQQIIDTVRQYMERNLLMVIDHSIDFKLVDSIGQPPDSVTHYRESGRFIRLGDEFSIKILNGLSRPICLETVAHEMAHAWQAENWPDLPGDELVEGFAQWIAARVLSGMGYDDLVERLHYREDVYGRGYRRVSEIEQKHGFSGVFRELERMGLPP